MVKVKDIVTSITHITKDYDHVRWSVEELLHWLSDAQDQIVTMHPRVASNGYIVTLEEGSRQDLRTIDTTSRWVRIHEVIGNVKNSKLTTTVRQVYRPTLDAVKRRWREAKPRDEVKEFMLDERDAFVFDVYPPVRAGTQVMILATKKAERFASIDDEFTISNGYDIPAIDYVLYRAFSKDANDQSYAQRSQMHLQTFQLAMGIEVGDAQVPQQAR